MTYRRKYFVQDTRGYVGNSVVWWRPNGRGYTVDIRDAGIYDDDEVRGMRDTDVAWPVEDVLRLVQHHVDVQDLRGLKKSGRRVPHTLAGGEEDWPEETTDGPW